MESYENLLDNINTFLNSKYEKETAGEKIFEHLKKILHFHNACIFYTNAETLTPVYSCNFETNDGNFTINSIRGLKKHFLKETLLVNNCPLGIIVISDEKPYTADEKRVFKTCSAIISSIIKELELTDIMKLQVKALQDGIVEINGFNKIIKEQNKKILDADKVKNKFLSNISHELRSPLNSIIGFSDMLLTGAFGNLNKKQSEYITDIQTAGIHLLGMVNEVLDISKIESNAMKLNPSEFEIKRCLEEVLNILKPLYIKKNINIYNLLDDNTLINADYQKLQQIFFNIISNAIKFTGTNGIIKIYAKITPKYITISIEDNGIGIEEKDHVRIFKKFEQINSAQTENISSTGLGLTITKELVKLHNGRISLTSELNKGTIFNIKLPL